jgi:hypothetical protein
VISGIKCRRGPEITLSIERVLSSTLAYPRSSTFPRLTTIFDVFDSRGRNLAAMQGGEQDRESCGVRFLDTSFDECPFKFFIAATVQKVFEEIRFGRKIGI